MRLKEEKFDRLNINEIMNFKIFEKYQNLKIDKN